MLIIKDSQTGCICPFLAYGEINANVVLTVNDDRISGKRMGVEHCFASLTLSLDNNRRGYLVTVSWSH
jgi:hypothetical protein